MLIELDRPLTKTKKEERIVILFITMNEEKRWKKGKKQRKEKILILDYIFITPGMKKREKNEKNKKKSLFWITYRTRNKEKRERKRKKGEKILILNM